MPHHDRQARPPRQGSNNFLPVLYPYMSSFFYILPPFN
ncbi:unnamed protein product [Schistosoma margrebowiei]|uniref:Uncharacterized protein n=1 Tax=Schistosoma margrebowiei TaxID=48269 RepID=A0A3P8AU27_9TREM|nr:unnamed protein product [Schistosoma margrebowiei]